MPDDRNNPGPEDGKRISLEQASERRYWSKKFGVTETELRRLVELWGNSPGRLANVLGRDRNQPAAAVSRDEDLPQPVRDHATDV